MPKKIVDVLIRDRLVASYPVGISLQRDVTSEDFVERVVDRMRAGMLPPPAKRS